MRIKSLQIDRFKNLSDFTVAFDVNAPVSVLVGQNDSGKSNLLEALAIIFRDLDLAQSASFSYSITYECRGHDVEIRAKGGDVTIRLIDSSGSFGRSASASPRNAAPRFVA